MQQVLSIDFRIKQVMNFVGVALVSIGAFAMPLTASAHQPRIVEDGGNSVVVESPEISKAYYGHLQGKPQIFEITATAPFSFYMNVLVPDMPGAKKDVSAALIDTKHTDSPLAVLDGSAGPWVPFHEDFAQDDYYKGPEFRSILPAGTYQIAVWSSANDSAYTLAVGEAESFPLTEIINAYKTLPTIKSTFFNKPAYTAYFTPTLAGPILILGVIFAVVFFVVRKRFVGVK